MARLRIKVGSTEVECAGTVAFLKTCMPELLKIAAGAGLSPANLQARDDALALVGGLQSDMQVLEDHHHIISDLDEKLSIAVRKFGDEVERFLGTVMSDSGEVGAKGSSLSEQLSAATKQMQETQMSFNLQYLQLQSQMQHENRSYTAVSNIMKTKHDTVKNSISNIR